MSKSAITTLLHHTQAWRRYAIALLTLATMPLASVGNAQTVVPGPWGDLKDHVAPLEITTDVQRITLYRREQMRAKSAHFRAIEAVVIYDAPYKSALPAHVRALQDLAAETDKVFVPGTETKAGAHGARPEIWQQRDKFGLHIAGFRKAADDLALAVNSGGALNGAYTALRHQCLACHQSFRVFAPQPKPRPVQ